MTLPHRLDQFIGKLAAQHCADLRDLPFRPEFQPPWGGRSHVTSLALNRLDERDGRALVQRLAGNAALTADIVAEIVERTDGVPLFVEELTKAVLEKAEQGDGVAAVLATTSGNRQQHRRRDGRFRSNKGMPILTVQGFAIRPRAYAVPALITPSRCSSAVTIWSSIGCAHASDRNRPNIVWQ